MATGVQVTVYTGYGMRSWKIYETTISISWGSYYANDPLIFDADVPAGYGISFSFQCTSGFYYTSGCLTSGQVQLDYPGLDAMGYPSPLAFDFTVGSAKILRYITGTVSSGGTLSPTVGYSYIEGTNLTFTATPDPDYVLASAIIDGVDRTAALLAGSFHYGAAPDADIPVTVTFTKLTHTIHASIGAGGTATPPDGTPFNTGDVIDFTFTPSNRYRVASCILDEGSGPSDVTAAARSGSFFLVGGTSDITYAVTFESTMVDAILSLTVIPTECPAGQTLSPGGNSVGLITNIEGAQIVSAQTRPDQPTVVTTTGQFDTRNGSVHLSGACALYQRVTSLVINGTEFAGPNDAFAIADLPGVAPGGSVTVSMTVQDDRLCHGPGVIEIPVVPVVPLVPPVDPIIEDVDPDPDPDDDGEEEEEDSPEVLVSGPSSARVGTTATYSAQGVNCEVEPTSWGWAGASGSGSVASVSYATEGLRMVHATALNGSARGQSGSVLTNWYDGDTPPPPIEDPTANGILSITAFLNGQSVPASLTVAGAAQTAPYSASVAPATYAWTASYTSPATTTVHTKTGTATVVANQVTNVRIRWEEDETGYGRLCIRAYLDDVEIAATLTVDSVVGFGTPYNRAQSAGAHTYAASFLDVSGVTHTDSGSVTVVAGQTALKVIYWQTETVTDPAKGKYRVYAKTDDGAPVTARVKVAGVAVGTTPYTSAEMTPQLLSISAVYNGETQTQAAMVEANHVTDIWFVFRLGGTTIPIVETRTMIDVNNPNGEYPDGANLNDPGSLILRYRDQDGPWSHEKWISTGTPGDRVNVMRLHRLGRYRIRQYEIVYSHARPLSLVGIEEEAEPLWR